MEDDPSPKWMNVKNDESHKAEVEPLLFGTGSIPLQDDDDIESSGKPTPKYGSIKNKKEDTDSDANDEDHSTTVITAGSSASSKSAKRSAANKKKNKAREIVVTESGKPEMPRPNCLIAIFSFIEGFGVIASTALMASQAIPLFLMPLDEVGVANFAIKIYISLFCLLFILVEWDVRMPFLRNATFLQAYFSRGFLYSFIGLSAFQESYSERVTDMIAHSTDQFHVSWLSLAMQVSAWMMLALGVVYMVFGLCCLKSLRDKVKENYRERWATYREAMKRYRREHPSP